MRESWHTYPSVYSIGHRYILDILKGPVLVEEKIDGSQLSFGLFTAETPARLDLLARSKGADINLLAPEKMFAAAVETIQAIASRLRPNWTYRAEFLARPKHNVLAYDRVPERHVILFDVNDGHESYLSPEQKAEEADRLGLEVVPTLYRGVVEDAAMFRDLLETRSVLGGSLVEGVVVKNYAMFGQDKKVFMGKFVSERFKETHAAEWKSGNPGQKDIVQQLVAKYRTPARWAKAVQHLREAGRLEGSPRDIGLLFKEVPEDVLRECGDEIRDALMAWAWDKVRRGICSGIPEWYKDDLLRRSFDESGPGDLAPGFQQTEQRVLSDEVLDRLAVGFSEMEGKKAGS